MYSMLFFQDVLAEITGNDAESIHWNVSSRTILQIVEHEKGYGHNRRKYLCKSLTKYKCFLIYLLTQKCYPRVCTYKSNQLQIKVAQTLQILLTTSN